jgi:hypothetical protein
MLDYDQGRLNSMHALQRRYGEGLPGCRQTIRPPRVNHLHSRLSVSALLALQQRLQAAVAEGTRMSGSILNMSFRVDFAPDERDAWYLAKMLQDHTSMMSPVE